MDEQKSGKRKFLISRKYSSPALQEANQESEWALPQAFPSGRGSLLSSRRVVASQTGLRTPLVREGLSTPPAASQELA